MLEHVTRTTNIRNIELGVTHRMATQEKNSSRIDVSVWLKDLRRVFDSSPISTGAVALLEVVNLQLGQSASYVGDLTGDLWVQRGLGHWQDDHAASSARLSWMIAKLQGIASSVDPYEVKLLAIYNYIARPVLDGVYPSDMLADLPKIALRGIVVMPDGRGKGFGDAIASATLWNQAVVAGDVDRKLGKSWAEDAVRSVFTQAVTQLQASAPGEPTTVYDVAREKTIVVLKTIAAAPGQLLTAIGGPNLLLYAGIAGVIAIYALFRE